MMMKVNGKTKVYGIIGDPVEHSLSPLMQNAAFEALNLNCVYVPFAVVPSNLEAAVKGLFALGVGGFNVTIPHKTAIIPFLDQISGDAELCGAVNTVNCENGRLVGYNTDGIGFIRSLKEDLAFEPQGSRVLLIGAGGAARGALASLCGAGTASIIVANRTRERGDTLIETFCSRFPQLRFESIPLEDLNKNLIRADLVVNTTSVGMGKTSFEALELGAIKDGAAVYDMVYSPPETPLLAAARARNLRCANGLGMLAAQGEAAFKIWTGVDSPLGLMKRELASMF